jgi:hypothetical protein
VEPGDDRLLRRLTRWRTATTIVGSLCGTALLLLYSHLFLGLGVGAIAISMLVVSVRLDRRIVALGGSTAFDFGPKQKDGR